MQNTVQERAVDQPDTDVLCTYVAPMYMRSN